MVFMSFWKFSHKKQILHNLYSKNRVVFCISQSSVLKSINRMHSRTEKHSL